MAARSDSAAASARCPTSSGDAVAPSRKCTPSTIASTEVTLTGRATTTAASSPLPRRTRSERVPKISRAAAMSANSSTTRLGLPVAVDHACAVEVVRRQLDADAIARQDADAVAAHLAGDVAEDHVVVVELHPEHGVGERLDDLTLELDLLFLAH